MARAYLLSAVVVLAAAGGSLLFTETASVNLSVPRQSIEAYVTLSSGPTGGPLSTQRIQVSATESLQGNASTVQISPAYASGKVVFSCSPVCQRAPVTIPQGQLITNAKSLGYATQEPATIATTTGEATVAVRAVSPGAEWNAGIESLTTMADNSDPGLKVTNPVAIVGGANARSAEVIQQSDYDTVRNALNVMVTNQLGAALFANAKSTDYVGDPWPIITVTSDHAVGDESPSFTITMSGTEGATEFSETQANEIMLAALEAKVPSGHELTTNDRIQYIYQSHQVAPNADVQVTGKANGFFVPTPQSVSTQIRGLSPTDAVRSLQRMAPGSQAYIRISPSWVPWLPIIAGHIAVDVVAEPARP